jgi:hypothetical protein
MYLITNRGLVALAIALAVFAGCAQPSWNLDIAVTVGPASMEVGGVTNLPDGAVLSVTLANGEYTHRTERATVAEGRYETTVAIDGVPAGDAWVEVTFAPSQEGQPDYVVTQFGESGELLAGPNVEDTTDGLRCISKVQEVLVPSPSG